MQRGRHRPDEERPPRREERPADWGAAERATTREIDRLQEAYQRLQEEQRRRREGADEVRVTGFYTGGFHVHPADLNCCLVTVMVVIYLLFGH